MTLTPADFQRVARQPVAVLIGVGAQYLVMPLVALAVARALQLPADLAAGLILVGCCPGGTASNVMTYLARGDVALSVSLTTVSTLAAVLATPWLMQVLGGQYVPVDAAALMRSILLVVILPVLAGLLVHRYGGAAVETAIEVMPALAVCFIVLIVGCVVGLTRSKLVDSGWAALLAVMLHNLLGLAIGYGLARAARLDRIRARTIAIEVGMQNSGLGVVLALQHFAARPLVALPAAIFSVWHNISGPALAGYWRRKTAD